MSNSGELATNVRGARQGLEQAARALESAAFYFERLPYVEVERMFVTVGGEKLVTFLKAEAEGLRQSAASLSKKGPEMIQAQALRDR